MGILEDSATKCTTGYTLPLFFTISALLTFGPAEPSLTFTQQKPIMCWKFSPRPTNRGHFQWGKATKIFEGRGLKQRTGGSFRSGAQHAGCHEQRQNQPSEITRFRNFYTCLHV